MRPGETGSAFRSGRSNSFSALYGPRFRTLWKKSERTPEREHVGIWENAHISKSPPWVPFAARPNRCRPRNSSSAPAIPRTARSSYRSKWRCCRSSRVWPRHAHANRTLPPQLCGHRVATTRRRFLRTIPLTSPICDRDSWPVCAPACLDQTQPGRKWPSPIRTDGR